MEKGSRRHGIVYQHDINNSTKTAMKLEEILKRAGISIIGQNRSSNGQLYYIIRGMQLEKTTQADAIPRYEIQIYTRDGGMKLRLMRLSDIMFEDWSRTQWEQLQGLSEDIY